MSLLLLFDTRWHQQKTLFWAEALADKRRKRIKRRKFRLPAHLEQLRTEIRLDEKREVSEFVVAKVAKALNPGMDLDALARLRAILEFISMREAVMRAIEAQRTQEALKALLRRIEQEMEEEAMTVLLLS